MRRGDAARLGTPASAAGSWPPLALGCDGAHRPQALADPLARGRGREGTGLEREGGDGGLRDDEAEPGGAAPRSWRALGVPRSLFVPLLSFAKRHPAHPWRGTSRPQRGTEGGGRAASPRPRRLLTGRCGGGKLPAAPSPCPPPSLPDKGSAMNSPPEPNKRLLSVGSILLLHQANTQPLQHPLHRRETAAPQPDGRSGYRVCVVSPPPPASPHRGGWACGGQRAAAAPPAAAKGGGVAKVPPPG